MRVIVFFLRRNVGRSWQICGARFNGERILIGAAERSSSPAPASRVLTVGQGEAPLPPAKDPRAGVVVSGNSLFPVKECWPELGADAEAVLRRTRARRRWQYLTLACSGENTLYGSWASGNSLSSCGRMLAGAGRFVARASTESGSLSELTNAYGHQLRRSRT